MEINKSCDKTTLHIIGIGGIGMSAIAYILHKKGFIIQGSDVISNYATTKLKRLGIQIFQQHSPNNINNVDIIIISSAISCDNIELIQARRMNKMIYNRAHVLRYIALKTFNICITGSHGKTSTTGLVFNMLQSLDPSLICGGMIKEIGNAVYRESELLILEADESDGTFLHIPTNISIITNIDNEHIDFYKNLNNLKIFFEKHIQHTLKNGIVIACGDCLNVEEMNSKFSLNSRFFTYSIKKYTSDFQAININISSSVITFDIKLSTKLITFLQVDYMLLTGFAIDTFSSSHDILNLLPSILTGLYYKLNISLIKKITKHKILIDRRFTILDTIQGVTIISDYAHHPNEIRATIEKGKRIVTTKKMIIIYQPHKYSRLINLYKEFINVFSGITRLIIMDIYPGGEQNLWKVTSKKLVYDLRGKYNQDVTLINDPFLIGDKIREVMQVGDLVIFMGAGNITGIIPFVLNKLHMTNKQLTT